MRYSEAKEWVKKIKSLGLNKIPRIDAWELVVRVQRPPAPFYSTKRFYTFTTLISVYDLETFIEYEARKLHRDIAKHMDSSPERPWNRTILDDNLKL